jgi:hypothetical protein
MVRGSGDEVAADKESGAVLYGTAHSRRIAHPKRDGGRWRRFGSVRRERGQSPLSAISVSVLAIRSITAWALSFVPTRPA